MIALCLFVYWFSFHFVIYIFDISWMTWYFMSWHTGDSPGLGTSACSGTCAPGYYCPEASTSANQKQCGHSSSAIIDDSTQNMFFCPQGSFRPLQVHAGYYSIGFNRTTRSVFYSNTYMCIYVCVCVQIYVFSSYALNNAYIWLSDPTSCHVLPVPIASSGYRQIHM